METAKTSILPYCNGHELIDILVFADAQRIADQHRAELEKIENPVLKFHYFGGVLDAVVMQETEKRNAHAKSEIVPLPASLAR